MAKVGEFYIATVEEAMERRDRYAVRERVDVGPGGWRRIASTQSHWQAQRIMKALTEQAKRDPLHGVDVEKEVQAIFAAKLTAHVWQVATEAMLKELEEAEKERKKKEQEQREEIARQFVAGKLTIQTPRGATIITKGGPTGITICTHKGGDEALTITIE